MGRCLAVLVVSLMAMSPVLTQSAVQTPVSPEYVFSSGAGLLVFHVRPERATDFEAVLNRLAEVLAAATDPVRQQQAEHWRMFRSAEVTRDAVLYVFFFDPAVTGADYDPVRVLSEALPGDAAAYYERLRAAVIKIERMALTPVR